MSRRSGIRAVQLLRWADISRSKYYKWVRRRGLANSHNGSVPRGHWIQTRERELIVQFCTGKIGMEGYRRLTYMMLDADVVAVGPATVYRVLRDAGMMHR